MLDEWYDNDMLGGSALNNSAPRGEAHNKQRKTTAAGSGAARPPPMSDSLDSIRYQASRAATTRLTVSQQKRTMLHAHDPIAHDTTKKQNQLLNEFSIQNWSISIIVGHNTTKAVRRQYTVICICQWRVFAAERNVTALVVVAHARKRCILTARSRGIVVRLLR